LFNIVAAVLGIIVSLYLLINKWTSNSFWFCPTNGCNQVASSSYSEIFGIPVSLIGVIGYIVILNLLLFSIKKPFFAMLYWIIVLIGFCFSLYLVYVSVFLIKTICFWCMISFIIITYLFLSACIRLFKSKRIS
jgi:uncharacterized membrane protein